MPGPSLQLSGLIIGKRPPTESFQLHHVFSPEHGLVRVHQRIPKKPSPTHVPLDLFDEVAFTLEGARDGGDTWFVKEVRLLHREPGLGRSYETLACASALAALVARNNVPEESRAAVTTLLRAAFTALAAGGRPDIVYLKSCYSFVRDEGYPLKQHWLPTLPPADRAFLRTVLTTPVAAQAATPAPDLARLQKHLDTYLATHTEILLDAKF